jgi:succinyl-CoA synthetase beta subunit
MRLHEYQAKRVLQEYGVPVPCGDVAASVDEVYRIAARLGARVVLKAQVLTGGRGQVGGILLANDADEAKELAGEVLGMQVAGYPVSLLLVDEAVEVEQETYVGVTIDRSLAQPVIVASAEGGVEIAEVAHDRPEQVHRVPIDPLLGLRAYQVRMLADEIGLGREHLEDFVTISQGLYRVFVESDATHVEANPLVISPSGGFCCLNSLIVVDDHALYRHREWIELRDESQYILSERRAQRFGITYVRLGGEVGCLSNGAGLAMATLDQLRLRGVRPANFVDIGKGADAGQVIRGLQLARNNSVEVILVNIFCSLTGCDVVARAIVAGCESLGTDLSVVIRLQGPNWEQGRSILASLSDYPSYPDVYAVDSTEDAVDQVVRLVQIASQVEVAR